jgi:hypothetical protein
VYRAHAHTPFDFLFTKRRNNKNNLNIRCRAAHVSYLSFRLPSCVLAEDCAFPQFRFYSDSFVLVCFVRSAEKRMRGNPSAASPPVSSCFSAAVVLLRISEFDRLTSVLSCLTSHPHIVSRSENTVGLGGQHLSIAFLVLSRLFGRDLSNRKLLLLELKKLIFLRPCLAF